MNAGDHEESGWGKLALLVIAGGRSSRMGQDKRWLEISGVGLLEGLLAKGRAGGFGEMFLCAEGAGEGIRLLADRYGAKLLVDGEPGLGPMEGLRQGLSHMGAEWAVAVAADMPFFSFSALEPLRRHMEDGTPMAILPVTRGRRNPLAALYRSEMADVFGKALARGERKIGQAVEKVPHVDAELHGEAAFFNVNTMADLRIARGRMENLRRDVPVISVVAPASGTGKTTFIERLLPDLGARGVRVGVVKSDAHGFDLDMEGKDSWRFHRAGARSVAVVSPGGWVLMQKREGRESFEALAAKMEDVDLVLTESRTHGTMPAFSLWRGRGEPMKGREVAALFLEEPKDSGELMECDLNDMERAAELCLFLMGR